MTASARIAFAAMARLLRLWVVVLAMACQVSAGALAAPDPAPNAADTLDAVAVFCQAAHPAGKHQAPPARHGLADPAVASAGHHWAQPAALAAPMAVPPPLPARRLAARPLPPARAPPGRIATATSARGPPALV
jgi:hypothetical protein